MLVGSLISARALSASDTPTSRLPSANATVKRITTSPILLGFFAAVATWRDRLNGNRALADRKGISGGGSGWRGEGSHTAGARLTWGRFRWQRGFRERCRIQPRSRIGVMLRDRWMKTTR